MLHDPVFLRDGRCVYHSIYYSRYGCRIVRIHDFHSFGLQLTGKQSRSTVVSANFCTVGMEIPGDGTHADSTNSDEINMSYVAKPTHFFNSSSFFIMRPAICVSAFLTARAAALFFIVSS